MLRSAPAAAASGTRAVQRAPETAGGQRGLPLQGGRQHWVPAAGGHQAPGKYWPGPAASWHAIRGFGAGPHAAAAAAAAAAAPAVPGGAARWVLVPRRAPAEAGPTRCRAGLHGTTVALLQALQRLARRLVQHCTPPPALEAEAARRQAAAVRRHRRCRRRPVAASCAGGRVHAGRSGTVTPLNQSHLR